MVKMCIYSSEKEIEKNEEVVPATDTENTIKEIEKIKKDIQ